MNYERPTVRPNIGKFLKFDHVKFYVGNAKQAASYYTSRFGFEYAAYAGLETGNRETASHVIKSKNGQCCFVFCTSYVENSPINDHVTRHGDGVYDVAFEVDDCQKTMDYAISNGAEVVQKLQEFKDENGSVLIGTIKAFNDTVHSFVQRLDYKGPHLPGFKVHPLEEAINKIIPPTDFEFIDHIVNNQKMGDMEPTIEYYEKVLSWHRFWSIDDSLMHTDLSALNSVVVADFDENIKMPCNEPAIAKKKSQIQEYVDYYNGAGVQHIAIRTNDIIKAVTYMRQRGNEFLTIPKAYYDNLRANIPNMSIKINEDIDMIEKLHILIDYDDKGYLLQLFTKPVEDRPTLFIEIIQRNNHQGFGAGNFKSLFKAIEDEQANRNNL